MLSINMLCVLCLCSHAVTNSLQSPEPLKPSSDIVCSRLQILQLTHTVAVPWGIEGPHGQRCLDVQRHVVQEDFHAGHLPLVHHEPPARVEGVPIAVDHHALDGGQDGHGNAGSHFGS